MEREPEPEFVSERLRASVAALGQAARLPDGRRPAYFALLSLPSQPFWEAAACGPGVEALLQDLRRQRSELLAEALAVAPQRRVPKPVESTDASWSIAYLSRDGRMEPGAPEKLTRLLDRHSGVVLAAKAPQAACILSYLAPGGRLLPHYGPTNLRLRLQFPLSEDLTACKLVCGDCESHYESGYAIIDDSFLHHAINQGPNLRVMLVVDLWHPGITLDERAQIEQLLQKTLL